MRYGGDLAGRTQGGIFLWLGLISPHLDGIRTAGVQFWTTMNPFISPFIVIAGVIGLLAQAVAPAIAPKLTDAQKLEIRTAQVEMFQAKTVLESTPQFQAFQRAQNHLNETALKVQRESKVDPAKWTLGQDLEYTAVPQPEKEKK